MNEVIFLILGQYYVYLQPVTDEENLPENAGYNPNDERLFSSANILSNAGRFCEKGKTVEIFLEIIIVQVRNG